MELPGLTKELYGMTKEEAFLDGICIACKKKATWYSPAGYTGILHFWAMRAMLRQNHRRTNEPVRQ